MKSRFLLLACVLVLTSPPSRAELLEADLSIFGMD
jgi:hypothetical protein